MLTNQRAKSLQSPPPRAGKAGQDELGCVDRREVQPPVLSCLSVLIKAVQLGAVLSWQPRIFRFMDTGFTVVLLIAAVALHLLGWINTVGVELLAFAIGSSWFMLFIKNVVIKNVEMLVEHINTQAATAAPSGAPFRSADAPAA